jgi:hypothetical protein
VKVARNRWRRRTDHHGDPGERNMSRSECRVADDDDDIKHNIRKVLQESTYYVALPKYIIISLRAVLV